MASHSKSPKHPLDTVIAYAPDNTRATKLVASVFKRPESQTADELHRWLINEGEIRNDPGIAAEIAAFFKQHGVKETAAYDRIFGCPHEEGLITRWAGIVRVVRTGRTVTAIRLS